MRGRKLIASLLSFMMVFSMVPMTAIAGEQDAAEVEVADDAAEKVVRVEYRLNDAADEEGNPVWHVFESREEAQKATEAAEATEGEATTEPAGDEQVEAAVQPEDGTEPADSAKPAADIVKLELRLAGAQEGDAVAASTLADREEGTAWIEGRTSEDEGAFVDLKVALSEELAQRYDIAYRVHADGAWLEWATDGNSAAADNASNIDDVQIVLEAKAAADSAEGDVADLQTESTEDKDAGVSAEASTPTITYKVHAQTYGWMNEVTNGATAGTTGQGKRLEAFQISLPKGTDGGISYKVHAQTYGWMNEVSNGATAGTTGQGKRLEAIQIWLTGNVRTKYDVYYRLHIQSYGWLNWAMNGASAGSEGLAKRAEALQIKLVPKNTQGPTNDSGRSESFIKLPTIRYKSHVQTYGWGGWVQNGAVSGTTGQAKRMEALQVQVVDGVVSGEVQVNTHVQTYGWRGYVGQNSVAGTTGQAKRVEAIQMRLTGELANRYDVWYRVHAQSYGWMGWTKNGGSAGTEGLSKRLEAVQIKLVAKGGAAPGSTSRPFVKYEPPKQGYQNPAGYYQVSSKNVTITSAAQYPWNYITPSRIGVWATRDECINAFCQRAREYLGTPYVWNYSCAPGVGVDCIGLVYQCAYATGMDMGGGTGNDDFNPWAHYITGNSGWHSHDANNFWNYGKAIHVPLSSRRAGDVISWEGHVAVYMGNDQIIEAYTGQGVVWASLWAHGTPRGCIRLFQ